MQWIPKLPSGKYITETNEKNLKTFSMEAVFTINGKPYQGECIGIFADIIVGCRYVLSIYFFVRHSQKEILQIIVSLI